MAEQFDVFLSHNSRDKPAVIALAKRLKAQGLKVWLDAWELRPGHPWQEALAQIIETAKTAAVLVGGDGLGPWEEAEMGACLDEFARRKVPVIPVLLPGCPQKPNLPLLLRRFTWVDLRDGKEEEGFHYLIWGITGVKPKALDEEGWPAASGLIVSPGPGTVATGQPKARVPRLQRIRKARPEQPPPAPANASSPAARPHIHGWPAAQLQALQCEAAQALDCPVIFRHPLQSGGEGPEMVVIPAGSFLMGSPEHEPERRSSEGPQHFVTIAEHFAIGRYAVTFEDYDRFCLATKRPPVDDKGWGRGRRPVIHVGWEDAVAYCAWLSAQTGQSYRLPSEAEWEYACRAGTATPFHFGDTITPRQANYDGNQPYNGGGQGEYRRKTVAVDEFQPNAFGLYQMHGNVWEWCGDAWHEDYREAPADGSAWVDAGAARVVRGGSWSLHARGCRSAYRDYYRPGDRSSDLGFRCARVQA